jgi:hypothetical protein
MSELLMTLKEHFRSGQGMQTFSRSAITIYDDHVECSTTGLGGGTDSIRYEQIAHVLASRGLRWATLGVQTTGGGGFEVGGLKKDEVAAAKALIDERMAAARQPAHVTAVQATSTTLADQFAQLSALRDSGALTDEEFAASKAQLLGQTPEASPL